ncbi:MAG TPA: hypothetical protein VGB25_01815 [Candidatus Binatia bacterium]
MRILVYGFGPYGTFRKNVAEDVVRGLPRYRGLKKVVFPVQFHRKQFISAVKQYDPDAVIGVGQCSAGKRLRIETRAVNERLDGRRDAPRPISRRGAKNLSTNLRPACAREARISTSAGRYVCNYSMYVILEFLKRYRPHVRYGFIHIPHRYDAKGAGRFLLRAMARLRAGG